MNYRKITGIAAVLGIAVVATWLGRRQVEGRDVGRPVARPGSAVATLDQAPPPAIAEPMGETPGREGLSEAVPVEASSPSMLHYVVRGRLVDTDRMPVLGGSINLSPKEHAESLNDGSFELPVAREVRTTAWEEGLLAKAPAGWARRVPVNFEVPETEEGLDAEEIDLGTLVLVPNHALRIQASKNGQPASGVSLRIECGHGRVFMLEAVTDEEGIASVDGLPKGPVHVTASVAGDLAYARAFVPNESELELQLQPGGLGDITVVDAQTGAGIPGALLQVRGRHMVPSAFPGEAMRDMRREYMMTFSGPGDGAAADEEGHVEITGLLPGVTYRVGASANGYAPFPEKRGGEAQLESISDPVRIELQPLSYTAVRWPIVAGEAPVPPEGSVVTLEHAPGSTRWGEDASSLPQGRMVGGDLLVEDYYATGALLAEAEDGSLAVLRCKNGAEVGFETAFRPARRVEVRVSDSEGQPVVDAQAMARNQGNNPLCEWVRTNSEGHAVLGGLYGELAEVYLRRPGRRDWGEAIGSVDLAEGHSVLDVVLQPEVKPARLRLTLLESGVPRLPGQFEFHGMVRAQVVEEDPYRGELLIEVASVSPGEEVQIFFSAVGYARERLSFEAPQEGSEALLSLDLVRTSILVADVTLPKEGAVSILPQKLENGEFSTPRELRLRRGFNVPNGPGDSFVFDGITPGTWRFIEERSGSTSDSYEVTTIDREVTIPFRLSSQAWVTGRIETPHEEELEFAKVLLVGESSPLEAGRLPGELTPKGAWLEGGEFKIRVPGDREVRLEAWHPWLRPDPKAGAIDTIGGREGVILKLVSGDELRLPVPELDESTSSVRIARYSGRQAEGEPLEWHYAPVASGVARCGLPQGTWTFCVDPGEGFAPLVLPEVTVSGVTTLPAARFGMGSTIAVRIEVAAGEAHPRLYLFATRLEEPAIQRGMNSRGESTPRLHGLSAGRYRVSYGQVMQISEGIETELVLDGESEIELTLDLR